MSKADQQLTQALSYVHYDEELRAHEIGWCRRGTGWGNPSEKGVLVATNRRLYFAFNRKGVAPFTFIYSDISGVEMGRKSVGQTLTFSHEGDVIYITMIDSKADLKHLTKLAWDPLERASRVMTFQPEQQSVQPQASPRPVLDFIARISPEPAPTDGTPSLSKTFSPLTSQSPNAKPMEGSEGDLASKLKELANLHAVGALTEEDYSTYKTQLLKKFAQ